MKVTMFLLLIIISLNGFSQTKYANVKTQNDTSTAKSDSLTVSTVFYITVNDLNRYLEKARAENKDKLTIGQFDMMSGTVQYIIGQMVQEKKNNKTDTTAIGRGKKIP